MTRFIAWLDRQTRVSEDEPSWTQTVVAGVLFLLLLIVFPALVWVTAAAMRIPA